MSIRSAALAMAILTSATAAAQRVDDSLLGQAGWGLAADRFGTLWVAGTTGAWVFGPVGGGVTGLNCTDIRGVAIGADNNPWFLDMGANTIYQYKLQTNVQTPHVIPTASSTSRWITQGPDGNIWFTEEQGNKIGRLTPAGTFTEFPLPHPGSQPEGITAGSDGRLWFVEYNGNRLGSITVGGTIAEYPLPTAASYPEGICAGRGAVYYTEPGTNKIGSFDVTTYSFLKEYDIPTANSSPQAITLGPDGRLYFTEYLANKIGALKIVYVNDFTFEEYPIPTANSGPTAIVSAPDGLVYFTERNVYGYGWVNLHVPGDANGDGVVNVGDVFHLIDYLFAGGPAPM